METVYDVMRLLLRGVRAVGGLTEPDHNAAEAILNAADPNAAAAGVPQFSDIEQAELERLQAKQQAAQLGAGQYAGAAAAPPQPVPGGGFHQAPPQPAYPPAPQPPPASPFPAQPAYQAPPQPGYPPQPTYQPQQPSPQPLPVPQQPGAPTFPLPTQAAQ